MLAEFAELCLLNKSKLNFQHILSNPKTLTQFILDPTSFNLTDRIHISDPTVEHFFKLSRDFCYSIHNERIKMLQDLCKSQVVK